LAENYSYNEPSYQKIKDIAERQEISKDYLVQLAVGLKNANLIRSSSGKDGGYTLSRPPEQINLLEAVEAAIGPIDILDCLKSGDYCSRADTCKSRGVWDLVNENIKKDFKCFTLSQMAGVEHASDTKSVCANSCSAVSDAKKAKKAVTSSSKRQATVSAHI